MRILFFGESPWHPTGFGHVNAHLLHALSDVADVHCVATGHYYPKDYKSEPYRITGCLSSGDQRNLEIIKNCIEAKEEWDVFFYQGDLGANTDVLEWVRDSGKPSIVYHPIDTDFASKLSFVPWSWSGIPVCYTNHGREVVRKHIPELADRMSVIGLGCDTQDFYPLSLEEKRLARLEIFGPGYENQFMVLNVNRNQVRKDLARCIWAFHEFHQHHPDSTLYLHSVMVDSGGSLPWQAEMAGVDLAAKPAEVAFSGLNLGSPWSREMLNKLYNACDVLVSTAYGEGWGLCTTEAMCAGLPVLVPYNTANLDILGKPLVVQVSDSTFKLNQFCERGFGIQSGVDLDHLVFLYGEHGGMPSQTIDTDSFLGGLEWIKRNPDKVQQVTRKARAWAVQNSWERREEEWKQLIRTLENAL